MIHYNSLWETMSNKHFTTYTLREKHNIGHGTRDCTTFAKKYAGFYLHVGSAVQNLGLPIR